MRLRDAREAAGLTQVQLSVSSGIRQTTISDLETGRNRNPSHETAVHLARALHRAGVEVTAEELFPVPAERAS